MSSPPLNIINLVTQCLCIPVVTIFVALRFYVRLWYQKNLEVEDYACFIAWVLFIAYCSISIVVGQHGGGYHEVDVSADQILLFRRYCYILTIIYAPLALAVKVALLSILARIYASVYRWMMLLIKAFLIILCCYYTTAMMIKIFMCHPISRYWEDFSESGGSCLDQRAALVADSVISMVSDAGILLLPIPLTWPLRTSRARKLRVIGLLGAGGLATAFSVFRLILVLRRGDTVDQTRFFMRLILSGNAEIGIGLICACLPAMNILITRATAPRDSSFQTYTSQNSSFRLRRLKAPMKTSPPSVHSDRGPSRPPMLPRFDSHCSQLTSVVIESDTVADSPAVIDAIEVQGASGIHKSVTVSQTVETMDDVFLDEWVMPRPFWSQL